MSSVILFWPVGPVRQTLWGSRNCSVCLSTELELGPPHSDRWRWWWSPTRSTSRTTGLQLSDPPLEVSVLWRRLLKICYELFSPLRKKIKDGDLLFYNIIIKIQLNNFISNTNTIVWLLIIMWGTAAMRGWSRCGSDVTQLGSALFLCNSHIDIISKKSSNKL